LCLGHRRNKVCFTADLSSVIVVSDIHRHADKINPAANPPCYPLRSNPHIVLLPPLNSDRRVCNNLVSDSSTGAPVTMSAPDNWPPSAINPDRQVDLTDTLSTITAQLTMISNRLDLQGANLARHAQRLDGTEGSDASNTTTTTQAAATGGGQGNGSNGSTKGVDGSTPRPPQPPRSHREDL
jgi:hypothetical protein